MSKFAGRFWFWSAAFLSVGIALYSYRLVAAPFGVVFQIDPNIMQVVRRLPVIFTIHAFCGATALLVGPFQFIALLRQARPRLHRSLGKVYVVACLAAGAAAVATAPHASGGPVAGLGFGLLGLVWIGTTAAAWRAAVGRDFARHRRLMTYSFALTFAAVTLRLQIPIGTIFLGFPDYTALSPWLAFTSWLPNLAAVWLFQRRQRLPLPRGERLGQGVVPQTR